MPPRDWRLRVDDILGAISNIEKYIGGLSFEEFHADQKTVDAVVRNLEVIGEATRHLSTEHEGSQPTFLGPTSPACGASWFTSTSEST